MLCHIYLELDIIFPKYKGQLSTRTTSVKQHSSNIVNGLIDSLFKIQYTGYVINIELLFFIDSSESHPPEIYHKLSQLSCKN